MTAAPVDPQIQQVIDALAASEFGPVHELTPAEGRAQYERMVKARGIEPAPVGAGEDWTIPGPGGDLPVRVYRPDADAGALPALVYCHGGGHVIGTLDTHDAVARNLCNGAGCVVVSVDYRLAPEHKFPAAAEDTFAAVRWCAAHGSEIGIDPQRLAVGGDSAGGNLAAVAALMARDAGGPAIRLQVLVYPVTDYGCGTRPCGPTPERLPSAYIRDRFFYDSAVFTDEALRHLIAVSSTSQIVIGTDYPFSWTFPTRDPRLPRFTPVEHIMAAPGLSDADRAAMLGGNAARLLKLNV